MQASPKRKMDSGSQTNKVGEKDLKRYININMLLKIYKQIFSFVQNISVMKNHLGVQKIATEFAVSILLEIVNLTIQ